MIRQPYPGQHIIPRPAPSLWIIAVVPMLQCQSGAVAVEAIPPRPNPRPDDPKTDVPPLRTRWQFCCRWARQWPTAKPAEIRKAVDALKANTPVPATVVLDVTSCGRLMADAMRLGAVMVLESALGVGQVKDQEDEVLRMPAIEGPGVLRAVAADGRLILADIPLASELRSRLFRPAEDRQGLERALALALWFVSRATGDAERMPEPEPVDEDQKAPGLMGRIHEVMGRDWIG